MKKLKTVLVMPAYNAEATLARTIADIPLDSVDELLLVDDASRDNTVAVAQGIARTHPLPFTIVRHDENKGYGGNQKNCYRIALSHGADIVVMLHPDYQYDPKLVKYFVEFLRDGYFDVMLGSRIRTRREALEGGMPRYKYYANRALSLMQNIASGRALSEWHTGMRAYTRDVLEHIGFERFSNDFIFDTQALFAIVERDYAIGDIPVPVRYFKEASSINFSRSMRYGALTVWETAKFLARRLRQFFRFAVAGFLALAFNMLIYATLLYTLHVWYVAAATIAFYAGAVVSFSLQKYWTFRQRSWKNIHYELALYIALLIFNGLANTFLLLVLVHATPLTALLANVVSNCIVAVWSFFMYKYVAFAR